MALHTSRAEIPIMSTVLQDINGVIGQNEYVNNGLNNLQAKEPKTLLLLTFLH